MFTLRVHEFVASFPGDFDAQDAGELAAEPAHPAFEPVAAVVGDARRDQLHQTGAVRPNHRHDESSKHRANVRARWDDGNPAVRR